MASRWEVTKAVRKSTLSSPSRLILLVLADVAEVGTAEVPEQFTPSVTVLAAETGLGRSTIKRELAALEEAGWVVRTYPDPKAMRAGDRVRYRLEVPRPTADPEPAVDPETRVQSEPRVHPEPSGGSTVDPLIRSVSDQDLTSETDVVRDDVERICVALADAVEANGSRRPLITAKWRTEARLLLDKDGRTESQVMTAIAWSQAHEFWRSVILSMPKLRAQYDKLRLAAKRPNGRAGPASTAPSRIPPGQECPEHRGQWADSCGLCRAAARAS